MRRLLITFVALLLSTLAYGALWQAPSVRTVAAEPSGSCAQPDTLVFIALDTHNTCVCASSTWSCSTPAAFSAASLVTTTFGGGTPPLTWTFDTGGTKPVLAFTPSTVTVTGALVADSLSTPDPGDDLRGNTSLDNTTTCPDPASGSTSICTIGGEVYKRDTGATAVALLTTATGLRVTGSAHAGVVLWGDCDNATDTGDEVCALAGLTCVDVTTVAGVDSDCTTDQGTAGTYFHAFCK